jgi:hypothetical protein
MAYKLGIVHKEKNNSSTDHIILKDWLNQNDDKINSIKFVLEDNDHFYVYYAGD